MEHDRIIITICEHIIAQNALAGGDEGIGIEESAELWVVISALEIVEPGLSVLGLTAMPDCTLDTHTKPHGFRVGIFLRMYIDLQLTNKFPNVDLCAVRQHVANGITGDGLSIATSHQTGSGTIIGKVD